MAEEGIRSTRSLRSPTADAAGEAHGGLFHEARTRTQVIGRIRPGIMALTPKARAIPGAMDAYKEGWRVGASFEDIERRLKQIGGCPPYPLNPHNVPWFRVCRGDWQDPAQADAVMDLYATQREGDKAPRLYEFPIVFTSGDLDTVFEETFEAWNSRQLRFWSRMDAGTGYVHCVQKADPSVFARRGAKQHWGGRPDVVRKLCSPNQCTEFLAGECYHYGTLRFSIPGIEGLGYVEMTFKSMYAKLGIAERLEEVRRKRGSWEGLHGGHPFFWVGKQLRDVGRIDWATGAMSRTKQDIITLSVRGVNMVELHAASLQRHAALAAPVATSALREEPLPEEPMDAELVSESGAPSTMKSAELAEYADERAAERTPSAPPVPGTPPTTAMPNRSGRPIKTPAEADLVTSLWARAEAAREALAWSPEDEHEWVMGQPESSGRTFHAIVNNATDLSLIAERLEALAQKHAERNAAQAPAQEPNQDTCPF